MLESDLGEIRRQIDEIDGEMLRLYVERMRLCEGVADYKLKNNLPVFQGKREREVLDKVSAAAPEELSEGARLLFAEIMDISKCHQQNRLTKALPFDCAEPVKNPVVACPGIRGSYSEEACLKAFGGEIKEIRYFADFDGVFTAVDEGTADYGVLPLENSTAGGVSSTYDLMGRFDFHICKRLAIPINHVLAAKPGTAFNDITKIFSHEQALHQCMLWLKSARIPCESCANTSIAAKTAADSDESIGCICSAACAKLYGLEILKTGIADNDENFTRFIVISKKLEISENADIVSLSLSLPHCAGALYRMLTKFAYAGLNLTKIESKPVPSAVADVVREDSFDVIFYLDFEGGVRDETVAKLLQNLEKEVGYYKFLGNYEDML